MKKYLLFSIIFVLLSISLKAQKKQIIIPVKVEFIERVENGFEVWVKRHNPHYKHGSYHLVKVFEVLPDSIKVGVVLMLYPSRNRNEFQVVKK